MPVKQRDLFRCYHDWLNRIHQFIVRPNSRVLLVGCENGELLDAVRPSFGVGISPDAQAVERARQRFGHLRFEVADYDHIDLRETFDYVLICNTIGQWRDIQRVLENLHGCVDAHTRIVITYYNYLWEGAIRLGTWLGLRQPQPLQNWLPTEDIVNLLRISDFDVIRSDSYVMMPLGIPLLSAFCNYCLSPLPGLRCLNLVNVVVARPAVTSNTGREFSVSVVVPCRNEQGNIAPAIERIPDMGSGTEIVFVEGGSTDDTAGQIKRQILAHPERSIRLVHQEGIGKGDAIRKGFAEAKGDLLVIQDADLTAPPEDLPKFYRALRDGKGEFINGSRLVYPLEKQAMRFLNLIGNKFFGLLFTWLLGQRFRDTLCGTKMIHRDNYAKIAQDRDYFGPFDPFGDFDLIFGAVKQNLKIVEVPVRYAARTYGTTQISRFRHGLLLLKMSWIAFTKIKWLGRKRT
jgi:hypothetical protein